MQGDDDAQQEPQPPAAEPAAADLNAFFAKRDVKKKSSAVPAAAAAAAAAKVPSPVASAPAKPVKDAAASRGPGLVNLAQVKSQEKARAALRYDFGGQHR